jgi:hypothetical protein
MCHPELHHFHRKRKRLEKKEKFQDSKINACTMLGLKDKLWYSDVNAVHVHYT